MRPLTGLAAAAADLLFPPECLLCQRSLLGQFHPSQPAALARDFCPVCLAELMADVPRCRRCGSSAALDGESTCRNCHRAPPPWKQMLVLSAYGDLAKEAVVRAKRPAGEPVGIALGRRLGQLVRPSLAGVQLDVVVPVPMHWWRRAVRGTSSAGILASAAARTLDLRMRHGVRRIRATGMQNTLPPEHRAANVKGAFRADRWVRGQKVLLVDDVITTGATVTACTHALLAAGAEDVYLAAVAKAERTTSVDPDCL